MLDLLEVHLEPKDIESKQHKIKTEVLYRIIKGLSQYHLQIQWLFYTSSIT